MKMTKEFSLLIGLIFFGFIGLAVWWFSDVYFAREIAPFQETADWKKWEERLPPRKTRWDVTSNRPDFPLEDRPSMLLRADASEGKLLIKHRYGTVIYLYDSASKTFSEVSEDDWLKAGGEIVNCWQQIGPDYNQKIKFKTYPDYATVLNGEKIDTYGRYLLFAKESPTHSLVALLSAKGPQFGPGTIQVIPFMGGSPPVVYGQKYVEIFNMNTNKFIMEPVRINGSGANEDYGFCWSADEKYLLAYKPEENFSVIEINKPDKQF